MNINIQVIPDTLKSLEHKLFMIRMTTQLKPSIGNDDTMPKVKYLMKPIASKPTPINGMILQEKLLQQQAMEATVLTTPLPLVMNLSITLVIHHLQVH